MVKRNLEIYKKILFLIILVCSYNINAEPYFIGSGLGPAKDLDIIMSANPPLPMLQYQKNTHKFSIQSTYFTGTNKFILFKNKFDGINLALNYSKAKSDDWGWFIGSLYTRFSSNHFTNAFIYQYYLTNIKANFITLNCGFHYGLRKQKNFVPAVNLIGGTFFKYITFSQSYKRTEFTSGTDLDFDMESRPLLKGFMIGGQMGWKVWEKILINPFGFAQIPIGSENSSYKITKIRIDPNNEAGTATDGINFSGLKFSGGINLNYLPWDLSINITSPFIRLDVEDYTSAKTTIITITKSFGDYPR